jgi:hypothetical protein
LKDFDFLLRIFLKSIFLHRKYLSFPYFALRYFLMSMARPQCDTPLLVDVAADAG